MNHYFVKLSGKWPTAAHWRDGMEFTTRGRVLPEDKVTENIRTDPALEISETEISETGVRLPEITQVVVVEPDPEEAGIGVPALQEDDPGMAADESEAAGEPDETWSNKQIIEFAEAKGIDLGKAKSKADLLAAVRAASETQGEA